MLRFSQYWAKEGVGYYEMKQHKPWFDDECSKLLVYGRRLNCSGCRIKAQQMETI